ncbi:MAG: multicopper oxidase family protein [Alphaproteobacteria bacterium]
MLRPAPGLLSMVADAPATAIWGYGGTVPGPLLRLRQGETLAVRLENGLDQPTTIHWHGIRIDNRMDGVAGMTQDAVPPGEGFDYRFTVPDAGTFWYHPHNRSWEQVARGLYGVLIVDETEPPQADRDVLLVLDDWRVGQDLQIDEASFGSMMDWSHAGRLGNLLTANGRNEARVAVRSGERVRLRLVNTANARVLELALADHSPVLIAVDGQPVTPRPAGGTLALAPGQRADLMVDMALAPGASVPLEVRVGDQRHPAAWFDYEAGTAVRDHPLDAPLALAVNGQLAAPDPSAALVVPLAIQGGAMGHMPDGTHPGGHMSMMGNDGSGLVWALNGIAGMPGRPLFDVPRGRHVVIEMVNDTVWPHAMHLHGHHMRVLAGSDMGGSDAWRDTVLIEAGQSARVGLVADNPGQWMIHCHMLEHQAGGMATWFRVGA